MNAPVIIRRADCISTKSRVQLEDSVFLEIINETAAVSEQSLQQSVLYFMHQNTKPQTDGFNEGERDRRVLGESRWSWNQLKLITQYAE